MDCFICHFIFVLAASIDSRVNGQLFCYSCSDQTHATTCANLVQCPPSQVCFLKRFNVNGAITYDTGCTDPETCSGPDVDHGSQGELIGRRAGPMRTLECETCCEQSICNSVECQPPSTTTTMATTTTLPTAITTSSLWSVWSSWTHCPYSCGHDGIQHRFRHCLDQDPRVCTGNKFDTKICHTRVCCTNSPVVTYIDSDQFVFTRSFLVLYCNATNFDTLSWRIPEVVGHSYPVNVNRPAGEPTVVISHITTENEGPYVCTVTNACGTASRVVNVKVLA